MSSFLSVKRIILYADVDKNIVASESSSPVESFTQTSFQLIEYFLSEISRVFVSVTLCVCLELTPDQRSC